ncbi:glycosyltransferase family 9 protein [Desulfonatronovibrio magnus]|uniref:glycosyltransferase family 9 protein n=1 Tax=Desulfonatronovibrio magnus TaxID=698827 RepID=UPI0005EBD1B6|nr:glycosyltransferase family 9 protein [Desulfonatronovibrio magnus]
MNTARNQRHALLINLTRFGDLIQSQPVLSKLKDQGLVTHLVCLENFARAAELLHDADFIHAMPGARFLALLDSTWPMAIVELQNWINSTASVEHFDQTINLTPSLSSRLLTSQFQSEHKLGFFLDELGFGCYSNNWAAFLQASSAHRGSSPFNIVDMFVRSAHLPTQKTKLKIKAPDKELISQMRNELSTKTQRNNFAGYVAFQLGASDDKRRWPVEYFALLGEMLCKELNLCPVLLGTKSEQHLAQKYENLSQAPHISLTGQTSLQELSATLSLCKLLVTNDTGTMHLAAGLGVRSAAFFLATAQPWDTGPYLDNCLCLEPDMNCHPCSFSHTCDTGFSCRKAISPETVFKAITHYISTGEWRKMEGQGAKVRATCLENDLYTLRPLNPGAQNNYSLWMSTQKHFYNLFLNDEALTVPKDTTRPEKDYCQNIVEHINSILPLLNLAAQQANVLKKVAAPAVKKKFLSTWQRLSHILSQSSYFPVLGLLWTHQSQAASSNLEEIIALCQRYEKLLQKLNNFLRM